MTVTTKELVAAEAHYHRSGYGAYAKPTEKHKSRQDEDNDNISQRQRNVW